MWQRTTKRPSPTTTTIIDIATRTNKAVAPTPPSSSGSMFFSSSRSSAAAASIQDRRRGTSAKRQLQNKRHWIRCCFNKMIVVPGFKRSANNDLPVSPVTVGVVFLLVFAATFILLFLIEIITEPNLRSSSTVPPSLLLRRRQQHRSQQKKATEAAQEHARIAFQSTITAPPLPRRIAAHLGGEYPYPLVGVVDPRVGYGPNGTHMIPSIHCGSWI